MEPEFNPPEEIDLPRQDSWPESRHRFDSRSRWAISNALGTGRPLLLRGEPGIGKSQLARAAAVHLDVPFLHHVVDERSERDDLLYSYDAISRLAEAQVAALTATKNAKWEERLAERNFIRPGVLWWAINWRTAEEQAGRFAEACQRECRPPTAPKGWTPAAGRNAGPVVLIDEIDKADPSVPNGLLESLGNDGFNTAQLAAPVCRPAGAPRPLIVITTNEERELPAAFLRRCLVLQLKFPKERDQVEVFLIERARVFHPAEQERISDEVLRRIIAQLLEDRQAAAGEGLAIPGAAEFLDIVRYLADPRDGRNPRSGNEAAQLAALQEIAEFSLRKNLDEAP